jgi:HEAT repeat protein
VVNARLTTRSAPAGLASAVDAILRSSPGPLWIGYAAPVEGRHQMCCWDSTDAIGSGRGCPGCRLEGHGAFTPSEPPTSVDLEADGTFVVLLRGEAGRVERIRSVSRDCALDAGGLPFFWLTDVAAADSVRLLISYVDRGEGGKKSLGEGALAAIAFHAAAEAQAALEGFTTAENPERLREKAAFWLGNARGRRGYEVLARMIHDDPSDRVRAHAVFALSQSPVPEAVDAMIQAARRDPSAHVRGQSLFWLAQKAGQKAAAAITGAIEDDPDTAVKERAVFALSQLPKDQGVPLLVEVARTNRNRAVRRQAMFWLGQSNDPRALEFIADVLKR